MKQIQHPKNYLLLFLILSYTACKKDSWCRECFERTGKVVTKRRAVSAFNQIVVNHNLSVFITQDTTFDLQIEAGENMMDFITTDVTDSVLTIQNKSRCNWTRNYKKPYNLYIKVPSIKNIISNTSGNVKSLNVLTGNKLNIEIETSGDIELTVNHTTITSNVKGSGNLILHGNVFHHESTIKSPSFLYCQDLASNSTSLKSRTSGLCYINVTNKLDCYIENIGDVYCYGNPVSINKTNNGKGVLYFK
jgi:hypothetical protein